MRSLSSLLSFVLLVPAAVCYPSQSASKGLVAHEKRSITSSAWQKRERVHKKAVFPMRIGLKQQNFDRGHELLTEISNPASPNYAQHLTSDQVIAMFEPFQETVDTVRAWLESAGIHADRIVHSDNKGWLAFDATAEEAEELLKTTYHVYEHTSGGFSTAAEAYHVPEHITEHIDYITPGIRLSLKKRGSPRKPMGIHPMPKPGPVPAASSGCDSLITPECIADLYQIPKGTTANPANRMGLYESGDTYDQSDLNAFFKNYYPTIPQGTGPKVNLIDGAVAPVQPDSAGGESMLDFSVAYPIIWPQGISLFQTDDPYYAGGQGGRLGFFNDYQDAIDGSYCKYSAYGETGNSATIDPSYPDSNGYKGQLQCGVFQSPNVLSVSYGWSEIELPVNYQLRQCNEFMKLALQGSTVIVASGDDGVASRSGEGTDNGCVGSDTNVFNPNNFACPYVTQVGATKVMSGKTAKDPEQASDQFYSGGGFSNIWATPDYQKTALASYFQNHNPPYVSYSLPGGGLSAAGTLQQGGTIDANVTKIVGKGIYNRAGRGMPDVSANGENAALYLDGNLSPEIGTSMSCPIFAAIINRINEERLAAGKKTVGFINPTLYAHPEVMNDIVGGKNPGCGTDGFSAVTGWDPVTGLGTANYPKMLSLFMSLP